MSILDRGHDIGYLHDVRDGKLKPGLGLNNAAIDEHILFKRGQLNFVLGHDNVGKTAWMLWYYLCLSLHHDLKWTVWSGENKSGQLKRSLIQMYTQKNYMQLSSAEITRTNDIIENYFSFVDNRKMYKHQQLLDLFASTDCDGCLIDPYSGLDRGYSHTDNYEFLNTTPIVTGKQTYRS